MMTKDLPWRDAHRIRLHHFANNRSLSPTSYIVPDLGQGLDPNATASQRQTSSLSGESLSFGKEEMLTKVANNFFFDMKLAGDPIQCSEKDGTCEDME
jgi:beta-1,2-xylosyltransferase